MSRTLQECIDVHAHTAHRLTIAVLRASYSKELVRGVCKEKRECVKRKEEK